jgi:hypothetical protein
MMGVIDSYGIGGPQAVWQAGEDQSATPFSTIATARCLQGHDCNGSSRVCSNHNFARVMQSYVVN